MREFGCEKLPLLDNFSWLVAVNSQWVFQCYKDGSIAHGKTRLNFHVCTKIILFHTFFFCNLLALPDLVNELIFPNRDAQDCSSGACGCCCLLGSSEMYQ